MIVMLFANKIKTEEPSHIFYLAAIEFLFDAFVINLLIRI